MFNIKKYNTIIWDWNGTLLNDTIFCVNVINKILAKYKLKHIDIEFYRSAFGFPVKKYYKSLGFDFAKVSFEKIGTEFILHYNKEIDNCRLFDSARESLQFFAENSFTQYILSARQSNSLLEDVAHFGIENYFHSIIGLNDHYAHGKQYIGKRFINTHAINPEKVLFLGDTTHDFEVAQFLSVDCALISAGHNSPKRLKETGAAVFASLRDFLRACQKSLAILP